MEKRIYPAIFHPEASGGYSIVFPDLSGCVTEGENLADAFWKAENALGLYLYSLKEADEILPDASVPETIELAKGDFLTLIEWDELEYLRRTDNKAVKKTLTIPSWLNSRAEKMQINFSQTLQEALLRKIDTQG